MKVSSISEVKKELHELPQKKLVELCLSLAKYKKDNKEFLDYLLFQAHDKASFITAIKNEIDEHFEELKQQANLYSYSPFNPLFQSFLDKKSSSPHSTYTIRYLLFFSDS